MLLLCNHKYIRHSILFLLKWHGSTPTLIFFKKKRCTSVLFFFFWCNTSIHVDESRTSWESNAGASYVLLQPMSRCISMHTGIQVAWCGVSSRNISLKPEYSVYVICRPPDLGYYLASWAWGAIRMGPVQLIHTGTGSMVTGASSCYQMPGHLDHWMQFKSSLGKLSPLQIPDHGFL